MHHSPLWTTEILFSRIVMFVSFLFKIYLLFTCDLFLPAIIVTVDIPGHINKCQNFLSSYFFPGNKLTIIIIIILVWVAHNFLFCVYVCVCSCSNLFLIKLARSFQGLYMGSIYWEFKFFYSPFSRILVCQRSFQLNIGMHPTLYRFLEITTQWHTLFLVRLGGMCWGIVSIIVPTPTSLHYVNSMT